MSWKSPFVFTVLKGPRISFGASGLGSKQSCPLGAPRLKIRMQALSSCPRFTAPASEAAAMSARFKPSAESAPTVRKSRRAEPSQSWATPSPSRFNMAGRGPGAGGTNAAAAGAGSSRRRLGQSSRRGRTASAPCGGPIPDQAGPRRCDPSLRRPRPPDNDPPPPGPAPVPAAVANPPRPADPADRSAGRVRFARSPSPPVPQSAGSGVPHDPHRHRRTGVHGLHALHGRRQAAGREGHRDRQPEPEEAGRRLDRPEGQLRPARRQGGPVEGDDARNDRRTAGRPARRPGRRLPADGDA